MNKEQQPRTTPPNTTPVWPPDVATLIMPGPMANYPKKNALSDIFDCAKNYLANVPKGTEHIDVMCKVLHEPTHLIARFQVYNSEQTHFVKEAICESDHAKRNRLVGCVSEINRQNGRAGVMIHDDLKQLCDLYFRVEQLHKNDWTESIWLTVEWLLNDIAGYYKPSPYPLNHQITDDENFEAFIG